MKIINTTNKIKRTNMNTKHEKFCDIHGCQLEERINVMEQTYFVCSVCEEENNIYRFDSTKEYIKVT